MTVRIVKNGINNESQEELLCMSVNLTYIMRMKRWYVGTFEREEINQSMYWHGIGVTEFDCATIVLGLEDKCSLNCAAS